MFVVFYFYLFIYVMLTHSFMPVFYVLIPFVRFCFSIHAWFDILFFLLLLFLFVCFCSISALYQWLEADRQGRDPEAESAGKHARHVQHH